MGSKLTILIQGENKFELLLGSLASSSYIADKYLLNKMMYEDFDCRSRFEELGTCWHLWTQENSPLIFTKEEDYAMGMNAVAAIALGFPKVQILTFTLMSNHIHLVLAGPEPEAEQFGMRLIKTLSGRLNSSSCKELEFRHREIATLDELRIVIVYVNRNGYVASRNITPYEYKWSLSRYIFNEGMLCLHDKVYPVLINRQKREVMRSHVGDKTELKWNGEYVSPPSYCDVAMIQSLFSSSGQYFSLLTRRIESYKAVADSIGEMVYYTDDDLYAVLLQICKNEYNVESPAMLRPEAKISLMRKLKNEYNASDKQLMRMLKVDNALCQKVLR